MTRSSGTRGPLRIAILVVGAWIGLWLAPAFGQTPALNGAGTSGRVAAFKYFIWGEVRGPGVQQLGPQVDIVELLSAAGGPTSQADLTKVDIIRGIDRRQHRINLKRELESGKTITLAPGDIVVVHRALWPRIQSSLSVVSFLTTMATLVVSIVSLARM